MQFMGWIHSKFGGRASPVAWPFDQARTVAAFTTRQVLEQRLPILRVIHSAEDDGWEFTCGTTSETADIRLISMAEAVAMDASLLQVASLASGRGAYRTAAGDPWTEFQPGIV